MQQLRERATITETTPKTGTLSLQVMIDGVNPAIVGQAEYLAQAPQAVQMDRTTRG
ncbi:MAG: hypothetical protein M0Z53_05985 [Thermaerobacter sp.]|nr:hypothetical protein [Thermaerobacter sp.]